jgi:DNA-binding transcriptional regulator YdaS (Cro superfamily)
MVRQLNQTASQRRAAAAERGRAPVSAGGTSREALLGLAQMAELVTASQLLESSRTACRSAWSARATFSLSCDYGLEGRAANEYGVGRELCYWEGEQLVYYIVLPDGLRISHRLSLAGDRRSLAIDTTVFSSAVSQPFSVRRVYRRYVPGSRGYRCTETLTRGRVCTTEAS